MAVGCQNLNLGFCLSCLQGQFPAHDGTLSLTTVSQNSRHGFSSKAPWTKPESDLRNVVFVKKIMKVRKMRTAMMIKVNEPSLFDPKGR